MFDHISIGVRDIAKAKAFYDAALKRSGYRCLSADDYFARLRQGSRRLLDPPTSFRSPTIRSPGLHFCFAAPSRQSVAAFHAAAMPHGGRDNGKPGLRAGLWAEYYAAFHRSRRLPARSLLRSEIGDGDDPIRNSTPRAARRRLGRRSATSARCIRGRPRASSPTPTRAGRADRDLRQRHGPARADRHPRRRGAAAGLDRRGRPSPPLQRRARRSPSSPAAARPSSGPPTSCPTKSVTISRSAIEAGMAAMQRALDRLAA